MKGTFKLFLKANERVFINGAVLRADRKVGIELLNDVDFLLEAHVMQADEATTPLRQLYFIIQIMLMSPSEKPAALKLYKDSVTALLATFENQEILAGLKDVDVMIAQDRPFDALKTLRALFAREDEILDRKRGERKGCDTAAA
ncbi:MAG: flagellar biosynthesis repressor FlbT [Roseitalea porphyridii]|uniref:Probable flagellum biosynthesis repressor protein FlbT n=1 Tax=Roseitalea porphyridii TaxID=1852022 RepID=A0A4P6V1F0_9HYPH|nr:flagellar biosynthesis repressor FlbT [Roseitalea porphyridii]QBK30504.1 flagellar biosynthesis repressor FlbT [Roseitalea porphyridii]